MTKANGRGRGWRRKQWSALAPSTKKKYLRQGINEAAHNRGVSPSRVQRWVEHQERLYGWSDEGGGEYSVSVNGAEFRDYLPHGRDLADMIDAQEAAEKAYESGDGAQAHAHWAARPRQTPEWMLFYHGHFS